ncbi:hypothetical protein F503_02158 [Ophiostoma piceae UAMH 11346]|uniref:DUF7730 domain-containing protein n=1 Tax=Ophiostoma piceae (strain UAMH 11346) TaxID=1262450 RepID=S3BVY8_OPHP1|nr:hypothetical protein F503_02158 [Ophiostoma piceae UAMH 11346]
MRRQIVEEAFGRRTLHMDLTYYDGQEFSFYSPPILRKHAEAATSPEYFRMRRHCDLAPTARDRRIHRPSSLVPSWQWFSCVCHRTAGYTEAEKEKRWQEGKIFLSIEPCDDIYADGIPVLYGTNSFHMTGIEMQMNLPLLVPQHHLSQIRSLQLRWLLDFHIPGGQRHIPRPPNHVKPLWERHYASGGSSAMKDAALDRLCAMIPTTFPHLQMLYLSHDSWLAPPERGPEHDGISEMEEVFLGPIEDMLRGWRDSGAKQGSRTGLSLEVNVAIQSAGWGVLMRKYAKILGPEALVRADFFDDNGVRGRFWKSLDENKGTETGMETATTDTDGFGYWICSGFDDVGNTGHDYWIRQPWGTKWVEINDDLF